MLTYRPPESVPLGRRPYHGLSAAFRVGVERGEQPSELQQLPSVAPAPEHGHHQFPLTTCVPAGQVRGIARSTLNRWQYSSLTSDIRASSTSCSQRSRPTTHTSTATCSAVRFASLRRRTKGSSGAP